jgi:hypothetical protein
MVIEAENYTRVAIHRTVVAVRMMRVVAFLGGVFFTVLAGLVSSSTT